MRPVSASLPRYLKMLVVLIVLAVVVALIFGKYLLAVATAIGGLLILALIWFPKWQVAGHPDLEANERFTAENEARKTLAEIVGGAALLVGLYFTWANLQVTQETTAKNLEIAQNTLRISREGQLADRFTKAIDQLRAVNEKGVKQLESRLGGIYALEQIARISPQDHWPIMEILTAYVREHARWPRPGADPQDPATRPSQVDPDSPSAGRGAIRWQPTPRLAPDIWSVLTVLGRRDHTHEKKDQRLDLSETDLRGAPLTGAHLEGASLQRAQLLEAHLEKANLQEVRLYQADLEGAHLNGANLEKADLSAAVLRDADLKGANLRGARLLFTLFPLAHLEGADLRGARLGEGDLSGAHLEEADLTAVSMQGGDLKYASLKGAKNLTVEQLATVKTLYQARLDPPFLEQIQQRYPHLLEEPRE